MQADAVYPAYSRTVSSAWRFWRPRRSCPAPPRLSPHPASWIAGDRQHGRASRGHTNAHHEEWRPWPSQTVDHCRCGAFRPLERPWPLPDGNSKHGRRPVTNAVASSRKNSSVQLLGDMRGLLSVFGVAKADKPPLVHPRTPNHAGRRVMNDAAIAHEEPAVSHSDDRTIRCDAVLQGHAVGSFLRRWVNLPRPPERQVVADGTGERVPAIGQGVNAVVSQSRRSSPDHDVAMGKAHAPCTVRA